MVFLALSTSLLWGLADFGGGVLAKRIPTVTVLAVSQTLAAVALGVLVLVTGAWSEAGPLLWFAAAAGVVGPLGIFCFYRALALGPMGMVSPLAGTGFAIPVIVALVLGERPATVQYAGITVAVIGVMLAGGLQLRGAPVQRQAMVLTLIASCSFGGVMLLIAEVSTTLPGLLLALFVQRVVSVAVSGGALWASVRRGVPALPPGGRSVLRATLPGLAFVGLADVAANGTYALAAQAGPVTTAAVLASLTPVVTALVARGALQERLSALQATGATLAFTGTLLLASG
jgi:drug/metabolite transporter (DMT)-like permease